MGTVMKLAVILAGGASLLVLPWGGLNGDPAYAAQQRPNIIFVFSNDQDASTLGFMPYVGRKLRASATTYPNATFNYSLCCPSRTSVLRGQYTHNHGVWDNVEPEGGYQKFTELGLDRSIFPQWLHASGYQTGEFGYYVNGFKPTQDGTPAGWDKFVYHGRDYDGGLLPGDVYKDEAIKDNAVRWLTESLRKGPLFMWVSFYAPHPPYAYDPHYADRFQNTQLPTPPSFNEQDISDKPEYVSHWPLMSDADISALESNFRDRLRGLLTVDDGVHSIVGALAKAGELDNTYIFYWTDNGYEFGQHRLLYKKHAYVESISFPLLISGPGVRRGATDNRIVMNQDLAPTFADLANARVPAFVDGRSMVPIFGGGHTWRNYGLIEAPDPANPKNPTSYRGIRDENYTYVEYADGFKEFYNLTKDPYQLNNSYLSLTDTQRANLHTRLAALEGCSRDECRGAEGAQR